MLMHECKYLTKINQETQYPQQNFEKTDRGRERNTRDILKLYLAEINEKLVEKYNGFVSIKSASVIAT